MYIGIYMYTCIFTLCRPHAFRGTDCMLAPVKIRKDLIHTGNPSLSASKGLPWTAPLPPREPESLPQGGGDLPWSLKRSHI